MSYSKICMLLSILGLPVVLFAGVSESFVSAFTGSDLFYFMYPFYILPIAIADASWKRLIIFGIVIAIESYVVHRMLKKACTVVVPRMIAVNLVEVLVQLLMFIPVGFLNNALGTVKVASLVTLIHLFIRFVPALVIFYVRWMTACKVYIHFEPAVNQLQLRRAMLWANGLSYLYLVVIFIASSYVHIL